MNPKSELGVLEIKQIRYRKKKKISAVKDISELHRDNNEQITKGEE